MVPQAPGGRLALGFINRSARLMRLSGVVHAQTGVFEEHVWYSDGMRPNIYDTKMRDEARIFRSLAGAQAYTDSMMRHRRTDPNGWQRVLVEDCSIGLLGFLGTEGFVQRAEMIPRNSEMQTPSSCAAYLVGNPRAGDIWRPDGCNRGLCGPPIEVLCKSSEDLQGGGGGKDQVLSPSPVLSRRD